MKAEDRENMMDDQNTEKFSSDTGNVEQQDNDTLNQVVDDNEVENAEPRILAEDIAQYEKIIENLKAKLSYSKADFENLRKRTEKQLEDTAKFAINGFAKDLLSVTDNLNRALNSIQKSETTPMSSDMQALVEGVMMTDKELHSTLEKHGVEKIEPKSGDAFDHNLHQAITNVPTSEYPAGTVYQLMQIGYVICGRLLRPAVVSVAQAE